MAALSETAAATDPGPFVRRDGDADAIELLVRGAKCAGCIAKIEGGVGALPGVSAARLNLSTGKLAVRFDADRLPPARITETVERLGYGAAPFDPSEALALEDEDGARLLRCLAVAGFAAANVMLLSISVWAGGEMNASTVALFHWISAAIALPAAAYAGRPFFESAWASLKARGANMDVPISLAVTLALGLSLYETVTGGLHAYFDAAVTLLFFLLIGRWLDHRLRARARSAARDLLALQAATATRVEPDGRILAIPARDVRPGDRLMLAAGDRAPVDAVVEEGVSEVDTSLATGETAPQPAAAGGEILSGSVNLTRRLIVRATARAEDSFLADLARLVEAGAQAKNRYVRLADRAARLYVPVVHTAAAATFLGWLVIGGEARPALINAIALLIITCPCALGLAAPAVQVVATGRLFARNVLVRAGDALERLAEVDHVVLDKTGTLTTGKLRLVNTHDLPDGALAIAAALTRASRHPLSRAVTAAAGPGPAAAEIEEEPGAGIAGVVDGAPARFGRARWLGLDDGGDDAQEAWLVVGARAPVRFAFADDPRPDAKAALARFADLGLTVEMMTGDREAPAAALARSLGVEVWRAGVSPKDKTERLDALAAEGRRVLMIGDGLNDAPALARAHASIAPGSAAEASQLAADMVLQGDALAPGAEAIVVARAARRRTLENFAFAALYNAIAAPLAAAGLVTPLIAAVAMSSSSLIVTLNALRLARGRAR